VSEPAELVFVGGTGRSGTTVLSRLLGRHSGLYAVPIECRFHCNPKGLADVVGARATMEEFLHKLRTYWWYRIRTGSRALVPAGVVGRTRVAVNRVGWRLRPRRAGTPPRVRGLHQIVARDLLEDAISRFEETCAGDVIEASRTLFYDLLRPLADDAAKPGLVEMSCFTIAAAPELARIFPEARFVHVVRDGRDSGVSKALLREKAHHPTDAASGIEFWADRLRQAEEGVRRLAPSDRDRLHLVGLDELVRDDREDTYADLLDFLGLRDEPGMRDFFDGEMSAGAAHLGRWREGLGAAEQGEITAQYEATLDRLEREGYHCAPLLRRTYERTLAPHPSA
jgi:sulfotransferase family protein